MTSDPADTLRTYLRSAGADDAQAEAFVHHHGLDAPGAAARVALDKLLAAAQAYVEAGFYLHKPSIDSFARLVLNQAPPVVLLGSLANFARHFMTEDAAGDAPDPAADLHRLDEPHLRAVCRRFVEWWQQHLADIRWDPAAHRFRLGGAPPPLH